MTALLPPLRSAVDSQQQQLQLVLSLPATVKR